MNAKKPLILILMGSDSDLPVMSEAAQVLEEYGVGYKMTVASAHRAPNRLIDLTKESSKKGIKIIIAGAGGAAHIAGAVAAFTSLPVIGVPIKAKSLEGLDSLLSMVQMPPGVPVATVAINGARNAGLLAVQILALSDKRLHRKLDLYKESLKDGVAQKGEKLEKLGFREYLKQTVK